VGIWDWKDRELLRAVRNVLKSNLCLTKEDKLVILTDSYKERVGELLFWQATSLGLSPLHYTYRSTGRHGLEPPEGVWKAVFGEEFVEELKEKGLLEKLLTKELSHSDELEVKALLLESTSEGELPTAVIAVNQHSISHTFFRKLCSEFLSIRFASMPLFEPFMFYTSLQANWNLVARRSREIANLLSDAVSVRVTSPLGTELSMSLEGRSGLADSGKLCSPGDFGNLPAGEAFIAPVEGSCEGLLVTRYAPDRELKEKLTLKVEKGKVREVIGGEDFGAFLMGLFAREKGADNVAEFGIGTNERAKVKTNILEAEKILGTCHVAVGDNSSFGGKVKANLHIDFLIEEPTVELFFEGGSSLTLIEEGRLKFRV
jgi:leucyl aminopeptidase (aminopeptidase T)